MLTKVALLVCLVISTADVIKRKDKGSPVKRQFGCSEIEFQCVSTGHCIQEEWTCDSQDDCGDNSDEAVPVPCAQNPAACLGPHVVRCNNGRCVPVEFRCDSDNDCGDNTDEIACDNFECPPEEFKCANGLCINARWRCDREDDCGDGSDEVNCGTSPPAK